jgi:hypothetical protein
LTGIDVGRFRVGRFVARGEPEGRRGDGGHGENRFHGRLSRYFVVVVVVLVDFSIAGLVVSIVVVEDVVVLSVVVLLATGGGVVTTVVDSFEVVGAGTVEVVVVVRSHAASEAPRVRAATRAMSFMCSPYGSVGKPHDEIGMLRAEFHRGGANRMCHRAPTTRSPESAYNAG